MSKPKKPKFYVVWHGRQPGVYRTWDQCDQQIRGFSAAKYKSFSNLADAEQAFREPADQHWGVADTEGKTSSQRKPSTPVVPRDELASLGVDMQAWAVDAACQGNPGPLEYQGVDLETGTDLFHMGPFEKGTVNVGEFLAIVHALALLNPEQGGSSQQRETAIYSDSRIGISWVRQGVCKTKLARNADNWKLFNLVDRAEKWLATHRYRNPIVKWETKRWGEIPADFGRK
ncbi:MAG: ribonuclease H family protein [Planctomycetota bacterium]